MIKQVGNGLFVLGGKYIELYNQIQDKTKSLIKEQFDSEELWTPSILSPENMHNSNYLGSFANQAQIVHRHHTVENNEEELGTIFTFFVLETILLARLMNVNPFDQPAVEQIKIETKRILS